MREKAETDGRFGASIQRPQLIMKQRSLAPGPTRNQENPGMNTYERLEAAIKARGVRTQERLEILRILQSKGGAAKLTETASQHEAAIKAAAKKTREALR